MSLPPQRVYGYTGLNLTAAAGRPGDLPEF